MLLVIRRQKICYGRNTAQYFVKPSPAKNINAKKLDELLKVPFYIVNMEHRKQYKSNYYRLLCVTNKLLCLTF